MDWQSWHGDYDVPGSSLARRLAVVQEQVRSALDACPPGPLTVVSLCAGEGRDLLEVLPTHPRRDDVRARLVELDPRSTAVAEESIRVAGLSGVEVLQGDAALVDHYRDLVPADVVLVCGVFGNIVDADIERTVDTCRQLTKSGGTVIWTRHRGEPDLVPTIRGWFEEREFDRVWLSDPEAGFGVGVHRLTGRPEPLKLARSMFAFVGYEQLGG
ncbi:class I SAM-dependent methyltransferase [Kribbella sp. NPDC049174]|uniref:class I SAM-dependent methyltransferase n=1 Tax=Kribbella sp. NPDC049174 TaxID=3364112 RepID=UPI003710A38D